MHWDLDTSSAHLRDAINELQIAWQEASESWNDQVSQNFCETHLEPIGPAMKLSLDAISRMQQILNTMQKECES